MKSIFLLLLLSLFILSCEEKTKKVLSDAIFYTCSMDPQVIAHEPGKCPICKMDLTEVKIIKAHNLNEVHLSDQQILLGNISTEIIKIGSIADKITLSATLNFDQTKASSVNSRIMGRVEKLYYKSMGEFVKANAPLYELYSEDLNNAKLEFLLVLEKKKLFDNDDFISVEQLVQSAKNKLILWGMNEIQIAELAKNKKAKQSTTFYSPKSGYINALNIREGDYVAEGGTIVQLIDLSTLWAEAQIYNSQLSEIEKNTVAVVSFPEFSNIEFSGIIEFVNPEISPDTRINLVRVSIPNSTNQLKQGMAAVVTLNTPLKKSITLPIDAVIRDASWSKVWIQASKNLFKSVRVETGLESGPNIEILTGLKEGDVVVVSGAYLLNSEYVFKKGANSMTTHE